VECKCTDAKTEIGEECIDVLRYSWTKVWVQFRCPIIETESPIILDDGGIHYNLEVTPMVDMKFKYNRI